MLTLSVLPEEFSLCKLDSFHEIPAWVFGGSFFSVTKTPEELSIVCPANQVPRGICVESGWRCLKIHGPLDLNQTGVLSSLADPLARAGISIFVISTWDTDYLLVKEYNLHSAVRILRSAGHEVYYSA